MKREEMIKRYEDIVLNIHGKAGDEERADYILALCKITQLICQLYQPEQDTKWQELKEWLKNQITDLRHIEIKTKTQSLRVNDAVNCFRQVLGQMQELEGEDE